MPPADSTQQCLIVDPANEAGWTIESITPAGKFGNFYKIRAGAMWLNFGSQQQAVLRLPARAWRPGVGM
jgi:hypothetical protein